MREFLKELVVFPPKMRDDIFTIAAVDNIDHNPSSTTSKESLRGTGISLFQHPAFAGQGVDRSIVIVGGAAGQKTVGICQATKQMFHGLSVTPRMHLYHLTL